MTEEIRMAVKTFAAACAGFLSGGRIDKAEAALEAAITRREAEVRAAALEEAAKACEAQAERCLDAIERRSLSSLTLEALLFRRDAINAELARRAADIAAALGKKP